MDICVGVDGSPGSDTALTWAIETAQRRTARLRLVHVDRTTDEVDPDGPIVVDARDRAAADLGADRVQGSSVPMIGRSIARSLLDHRDGADLVVVGARGRGGFAGLLLGSVSQQVAAHAPGPVAVVPGGRGDDVDDPATDRALVVGVEGSTGSAAALRWAFDEAATTGRRLVAVHSYHSIEGSSPRDSLMGFSRSQIERLQRRARDIARETVATVVETTRAGREAVEVELVVEEGSPEEVLVAHARRASSELVVGRHGSGRLPGRRLGSTSQTCLRHAGGPVVVVPHDD